MSSLDSRQVRGVWISGRGRFGGLFALGEAGGELAAGARGGNGEGWGDGGC